MEAQKVLFIKYGSDEKNEGLWTEQKSIWDFTFMGFVTPGSSSLCTQPMWNSVYCNDVTLSHGMKPFESYITEQEGTLGTWQHPISGSSFSYL